MPSELRTAFVQELVARYGAVDKLPNSQSLFELGNGACRVYLRYSKVHERRQTFFGLRRDDLRQLEGHQSFICFLWDGQAEPLVVPFADYEEVFSESPPAADGQHKVQVYPRDDATVLYIARSGRFNVDGHLGWSHLDEAMRGIETIPILSHAQVQTLLGAIGAAKDYDVWIPAHDRNTLDWDLTPRYNLASELPLAFESVRPVLQEIDVIWLRRGAGGLAALYEVEHSTPIYTGLLRLNDVRLAQPTIDRLTIVSNETRRSAFVRQLSRPTFSASSLSTVCTFLEYSEVYEWYKRIVPGAS